MLFLSMSFTFSVKSEMIQPKAEPLQLLIRQRSKRVFDSENTAIIPEKGWASVSRKIWGCRYENKTCGKRKETTEDRLFFLCVVILPAGSIRMALGRISVSF